MSYSPDTIVIFSLEQWGEMWYSKHHYAARLARSHVVYFVSLPDRWKWTDLFSFGIKVTQTPEGVNVVEYRNNLPLRALSGKLAFLITRINAWKLRRIIHGEKVLLWSFHPTTVLYGKRLRKPGTKLIYHVVDPYQNQPNDSDFARRSDLVVAINPWYLKYYSTLNSNCVLIPHGVRIEDRTRNTQAAKDHKDKWGSYAVLATGVNRYVNYSLLIRVAKQYPGSMFAVAGQLFPLLAPEKALRDQLFDLPNVVYIGIQHPDKLKDLVYGATLGLLTYEFEPTLNVPLSAGRTPLKVLTYLAQFCPVVSTNNSYIPIIEGKGHFKAEHEDHFVKLVGEAFSGHLRVDKDVVEQYLESVEYDRLIQQILAEVDPTEHAKSMGEIGHERATTRPTLEQAADPYTTPTLAKDCAILIVSNEEWNGPRYSKHRYAIALSTLRRVFFIDPPDQWRIAHLFKPRIQERSTPEGVKVLSYNNAIPLLGGRLGTLNDRIVSRRIRGHLDRLGWGRPLFWTFDPSRLVQPGYMDAEMAVYHCADDHAFHWKGERSLARRCDHVFCIAKELMSRFQDFSPSVLHVPHGLSEEDMRPPALTGRELPAKRGYGLYIGNINDRHDFALWEKMFRAHPSITWVIVGPVHVTDPLAAKIIHQRSFANVIILGPVPYTDLLALIAGARFGFLFMKRDHPANRISSQKILQFLALGKPFFCSWFSEYADHRDLIHMTDDSAAALGEFERWLVRGDAPGAVESRLAFAKEQQFSKLITRLPFHL